MNLVTLAGRNLLRRPTRNALSILGIALAVGSAVALLALSRGISYSVHQAFDERGASLTLLQRGAADVFSGFLPEGLRERIGAVPGVEGVSGELIVFATTESRRHVLVAGWQDGSFAWNHLPLRAGRAPQAGERRVVVLGDRVAEALERRVGDTIELFEESFRVVGISAYESVLNRGLVVLPLAELQELTFRPNQVTGFLVRAAPTRTRAELERLKQDLAAVGPVIASDSRNILADDRNVRVLNAISQVVSLIGLAMGALGVLNTMLITVQERTREIGILSALGWSEAYLMGLILIEGLLLGSAGCALGVALGVAATGLFGLVPAIGAYLSFRPEPLQVLLVAMGAGGLSLAGALYPAWRALRVDPLEALRRI